MGKIMVTGVLGNVGGYVAQYLINHQQPVKLVDINLDVLTVRYPQQQVAYFDFKDPSTFEGALNGVDRIFIMRPPHLGNPKDLKPLIDYLAKLKAIKLVVFLSLIGIENNPIPPHYKIEKLIEKAGLPFCHVRPSFFMQNISGIHAFEIKYCNRIVVPASHALTSFIDAQDVGEVIGMVLSNPTDHLNCAYSITGPQALDYDMVATILSTVLARQITYANPDILWTLKYWKNLRKIDGKYANVMAMLYLMTRFGGAKTVTPTFKHLMGHEATSLQEFANRNQAIWLP